MSSQSLSIQEIEKKLQRPLPPEAIKPHPTKSFLSTIKAIYVTERFNEAFGVNGWSIKTDLIQWFEVKKSRKDGTQYSEYTVLAKTVFTATVGIYHECIASSSNEDLGDAAKGATTDAITKIGSYLGVGGDVFKGLGTTSNQPPANKQTPKSKVLPELTEGTKQYDYTVKRLRDGVKIADVKKVFKISEELESKLKQHEENN